jgi:hypothetical protein
MDAIFTAQPGRSGQGFSSSELGADTMARIPGVEPGQAGLGTRLLYWLVRRKVGKLTGRPSILKPVKIAAHHPRLLRAMGQMEMGQEAARSVPVVLKSLASIKAAMLVGCPF